MRSPSSGPEAIEQINKLNDPQQLRKRTTLALPSPQLNDEEPRSIYLSLSLSLYIYIYIYIHTIKGNSCDYEGGLRNSANFGPLA